jgi:hypothetical protein
MKVIVAVLLLASCSSSAALKSEAKLNANPIRKVVTMLQNMQKKIAKQGETAEKLFDKYMCYCKNGEGALEKSIADAEEQIPQMEAAIKEELAEKKQLEADLKQHKADRAEAKEAIAKATAIREKEHKEYEKLAADATANIGALSKAIPAIEQGMGAFLQTGTSNVLRKLSISANMNSADRDLLAAFLDTSADSQYAPKSGEILGILKQMKDEMKLSSQTKRQPKRNRQQTMKSLSQPRRRKLKQTPRQSRQRQLELARSRLRLPRLRTHLKT